MRQAPLPFGLPRQIGVGGPTHLQAQGSAGRDPSSGGRDPSSGRSDPGLRRTSSSWTSAICRAQHARHGIASRTSDARGVVGSGPSGPGLRDHASCCVVSEAVPSQSCARGPGTDTGAAAVVRAAAPGGGRTCRDARSGAAPLTTDPTYLQGLRFAPEPLHLSRRDLRQGTRTNSAAFAGPVTSGCVRCSWPHAGDLGDANSPRPFALVRGCVRWGGGSRIRTWVG